MIPSIQELFNSVNELKEKFAELGYNSKRVVDNSIKRSFRIEAQSNVLCKPLICNCISTLDPLSLNRVRIYHPLLCKPETKVKELPFARNCTNTGGFDDSGGCWVPPAGSSVLVICENGDRQLPIVIGTVWRKNRGPQASKFPYPITEFYKLWAQEQYRGLGYLVGATDGSQDYPPWSTENTNINQLDNEQQIDKDPDAQQKITYPNAYGWKTPGKHYIKMVDGDYRCNNRWARFEIMSKTGHFFIMKDDWYHESGSWANPKGACAASGPSDEMPCEKVSALLSENVSGIADQNGEDIANTPGGSVGGPTGSCHFPSPQPTKCTNPYQKRIEECRPYKSSVLPQGNKCELPQNGIFQQSVSGHQYAMDDAVNVPREDKINWMHEYNTGCDNKLQNKYYFKSATGHFILMDDTEDISAWRGERNGIRLQSAAGNYFYMRDHTLPGCIAGPKRGIEFGSTGGHVFEMNDNQNEQCSPTRASFINPDNLGRMADVDPAPVRKAKNAYVRLRTGYGLLALFDDDTSQEETRSQRIMLMASPKPPKTDPCQSPHMLLMQLDQKGGGFIELACGGTFILSSKGRSKETVGTPDCSANKESLIFGNYLIDAKEVILTKSSIHLDIADKYIVLGAGQDCAMPKDAQGANDTASSAATAAGNAAAAAASTGKSQETKGPCIYPLIIAKNPCVCPITGFIHWMNWSDRVFASSSQDSPTFNC